MLPNYTNKVDNKVEDMVFAVLEALPDAALLIEPDGLILNANRLFTERFGKHPQECVGTNIYDLIQNVLRSPALADHLREKCSVVLRSSQRSVFEDDTDIWKISISPVLSTENEIRGLLVIIQNISEEKQIDKKLQKERELKTALLDAIPCSATIMDADLHLIAWNKYAHDLLFGTTEEEQPLVAPVDFFCTSNMELLRKQFLKTLDTGADDNTEMEIRPHGCPDPLWLMTRSKRIEIDGKPCVVSIGIDITERKKVEEDLIENKLRFGYALDASRSGIWEWDVITDELRWSDQVWSLYGLPVNSSQLNHQLCVDTVHPEDREMASLIIKSAVSAQAAASLEYRVCHPDGSVRWLTSRGMPLLDADGKVTRYIGAIIDITERKQIELELIKNKTRLSQALEAARAGVWEWDLTTDENIWSDEIWPLYGLEPCNENPNFRLWSDSIHPDDRESAILAVTEAAKFHTELNVEYRICHPDGSVHWLLSRGKPFMDAFGNTVRYIGTIFDITKRKEVEITLNETQARYDFALEATNAGVWEWNLKADTVIWSDRIWALYDMAPHSMPHSHKLCATHVHPDDQEITFMNVLGAASRNLDINVEYRVRHRNGSIHWLKCRGVPMKGPDGETTCYRGTVMDITERKLKDEELRKSRERLNFVLQKSHLGVWDLDLKSRVAHHTHEHARIFGYETPLSDWSLDRFLGHIVPEDREWVETLTRKSNDTHENYTFECRIISARGELRWIWVFGAFELDINGSTNLLSGIVQDITERKKTELLLKDSELKFRNIFEFSPIAISIRDPEDGRLLDVNVAWLNLFEYSREELIGRSVLDLGIYVHAEDHEKIAHKLLDHGRIINSKVELRKKSGQIMDILFSAEFITMNGKTSLLVMLSDITLQKLQQASITQLEKAVAERTHQLQQEVERLRRFMSMISHEYRTPLAIIRGNLDLIDLKHKSVSFSNSAEMLKIKRAIDRLVEVMEVSIQESRILQSHEAVVSKHFQLAPIVSSQLEAFQSMWPERSILYSEHLGSREIIGEAAQLKMAIFNLLDNARKYSPPESLIELDCHIENEEAVITIRNKGKRIRENEGEEYFEKYRRGSNAVNTAGAGLGLWLVRNIVNQHKGHVTLAGTESGVEVVVRLPLIHGNG
jgi:PAS domain S-box-containing protein